MARAMPTIIARTSLNPGVRSIRNPSMRTSDLRPETRFVYRNARFVVKRLVKTPGPPLQGRAAQNRSDHDAECKVTLRTRPDPTLFRTVGIPRSPQYSWTVGR